MSKVLIASGGTVETVCLKCVANKARSEGEEVGQRYGFATPHGEYVWDVEKALRLVNANINDRATRGDFVVFDRQMMETWLTNLQPDAIDIDHARHVNILKMVDVPRWCWPCRCRRPRRGGSGWQCRWPRWCLATPRRRPWGAPQRWPRRRR